MLVGAGIVFPSVSASAAAKISICDFTAANTNPYVQHSVDPSSAGLSGHTGHTGPVWNPTLWPTIQWGDIIPPYDLTQPVGTVAHDGLNWTAGQAIWNNGCNIPTVVTPATVTASQATCAAPTTASYVFTPTTGVVYKVGTTVISNGGAATVPSSVTVIATPASAAYTLTGTTSWALNFVSPTGCGGGPTNVAPAAVTGTTPSCAALAATYTVPSMTGVVYSLSTGGGPLAATTYNGTLGTSVTVVATSANTALYTLTGTASWTFPFTDPGPCPGGPSNVTPAAVTGTTPSCASLGATYTIPVSSVASYALTPGGTPLSAGTHNGNLGTPVTVYATTLDPALYTLTGTTSWTFPFAVPAGCGGGGPISVAPAAVTGTTPSCASPGATYTIPTSSVASYALTPGGTPLSAGTHNGNLGTPVTVYATTLDAALYTLTGTTSWTFPFAVPTGCGNAPPVDVPAEVPAEEVVTPIQGETEGEAALPTPTKPVTPAAPVTPEPVISGQTEEPSNAPVLPFSGSYTDKALGSGVALLTLGLFLALAGRRRRTV